MSKRSLPSLRHLALASESLPDADLWPEESYNVFLEKQNIELTFRRIKLNKIRDGRLYRWVYDGKVIVK